MAQSQHRSVGERLTSFEYGDTVVVTYESRSTERVYTLRATVESVRSAKGEDGFVQVQCREDGEPPKRNRNTWYLVADYDTESGWRDDIGLFLQPDGHPEGRPTELEPFGYNSLYRVTDITRNPDE